MKVEPVRTAANYEAALKEISALMQSDPEIGTADGDRLDLLVTLVQAYEAKHHPIDPPDANEAVKFAA